MRVVVPDLPLGARRFPLKAGQEPAEGGPGEHAERVAELIRDSIRASLPEVPDGLTA